MVSEETGVTSDDEIAFKSDNWETTVAKANDQLDTSGQSGHNNATTNASTW